FSPVGATVAVAVVALCASVAGRRWSGWHELARDDWIAVGDFIDFSFSGWRRWISIPLSIALTAYLLRALILPSRPGEPLGQRGRYKFVSCPRALAELQIPDARRRRIIGRHHGDDPL
ncbi:MAG: hypothetical protein ABEN55_19585, partial [Bradymonadaceae bacterium]